MKPTTSLLNNKLVVVHLGIQLLADSLREQAVLSCHVDWSPPATNNEQVLRILRSIYGGGRSESHDD